MTPKGLTLKNGFGRGWWVGRGGPRDVRSGQPVSISPARPSVCGPPPPKPLPALPGRTRSPLNQLREESVGEAANHPAPGKPHFYRSPLSA